MLIGLAITEIMIKKGRKQENKNIKNVKRCRDGMPKVCKQGWDGAWKQRSTYWQSPIPTSFHTTVRQHALLKSRICTIHAVITAVHEYLHSPHWLLWPVCSPLSSVYRGMYNIWCHCHYKQHICNKAILGSYLITTYKAHIPIQLSNPRPCERRKVAWGWG